MKRDLIFQVFRDEDGNIETYIKCFNGMDTILIGCALASATRVAAQVFTKILNSKQYSAEQLEAQIVDIYNKEMLLGEEKNILFIQQKDEKSQD